MTSSVRLAAEESRNIQLIFLAVVMHRCRPAVRVKTLRRGAACILRYRIYDAAFGLPILRHADFSMTAFGVAGGRPLLRPLDMRHWTGGARRWRRDDLVGTFA
jgi:hypothetical protein